MDSYWLRLTRRGGTITASVSADGKVWAELGTAAASWTGEIQAGLAACSGLPAQTTTMTFDNVEADASP